MKLEDLPPGLERMYDPETGEYCNAETIEAMREAEAIAEGKIPAKRYNSFKELLEDVLADADD